MRLVIVKHVTVKMRKRMRNGADPRMRNRYGDKMRAGTDMGIKCGRNGYGDKMRRSKEFFRPIFTFLCF
jgi:hypothetical protein